MLGNLRRGLAVLRRGLGNSIVHDLRLVPQALITLISVESLVRVPSNGKSASSWEFSHVARRVEINPAKDRSAGAATRRARGTLTKAVIEYAIQLYNCGSPSADVIGETLRPKHPSRDALA